MTTTDQEQSTIRLSSRTRALIFVIVLLAAACIAIVGVLIAADDRSTESVTSTPVAGERLDDLERLLDDGPIVVFEHAALGSGHGSIAAAPLDDPAGPRLLGDLRCERLDFRAGRGVCLRADRGVVTSYDAVVFDDRLDELHRIGLAGIPSRTRVSPSGETAAITVFVNGHSYAVTGFSTQTVLVDLRLGDVLADLEVDFTVRRSGEVWREVDFNFWGVTFVDDDRFYATLGTGGETYLVEGHVPSRELEVLVQGVECPSLSPDGSRVAHKRRRDDGVGPVTWQIAVIDLDTLRVTELAEDRNVDDQVAWLDDDTITYGLPRADSPAEPDTWAVAADGSGEPRLLIEGAWSAVTVRE